MVWKVYYKMPMWESSFFWFFTSSHFLHIIFRRMILKLYILGLSALTFHFLGNELSSSYSFQDIRPDTFCSIIYYTFKMHGILSTFYNYNRVLDWIEYSRTCCHVEALVQCVEQVNIIPFTACRHLYIDGNCQLFWYLREAIRCL